MHLAYLLTSLLLFVPPQAPAPFSAVVTPSEATFRMSMKPRDRWTWNRDETADMKTEYRMEVKVTNEGKEYSVGFYHWKHADFQTHRYPAPGSGSLADLLAAVGQKTMFERTAPDRSLAVADAEIKIKAVGNTVVISLTRPMDLQRLFSGRPAKVVFNIKTPDEEEIVQTVRVVYR
jgi:hypothetical protein